MGVEMRGGTGMCPGEVPGDADAHIPALMPKGGPMVKRNWGTLEQGIWRVRPGSNSIQAWRNARTWSWVIAILQSGGGGGGHERVMRGIGRGQRRQGVV